MSAYRIVKWVADRSAHFRGICWFVVFALLWGVVGIKPAEAQTYAYPKAGQSQQQQSIDQAECRQWAMQQTGYNPNAPVQPSVGGYAAPPPPTSSSGLLGFGSRGMWGDAARGAALGAAGGALAGNAGRGAAIGTLAGTLFGGIRRRSREQERQAWMRQREQQARYQQQQANDARQHGSQNFNRAFGACMTARNYQVQ